MTARAARRSNRTAVHRARACAVYAGLTAMALAAATLSWHFGIARARAHELARNAGSYMLRYARAQHVDAPRTLRLNGLPLHVSSGSTTDPVHAVLDFFHERCRQAGNSFVAPLAGAQSKRDDAVPAAPNRHLLEPIVRDGGDQSGWLGCLDFGVDHLAPQDLLRRARAFAASGDLAALGDLRFVWAMRDDSGDTSYVALATEGPVAIPALFPARGDAPGADMPDVPRPPGSRRVLSAYQEHAAPSIVSYRVELPAEAARARYRRHLIDGGFVVRERAVARGETDVLEVRRERSHLAVVVTASGAQASSVTLLPLR